MAAVGVMLTEKQAHTFYIVGGPNSSLSAQNDPPLLDYRGQPFIDDRPGKIVYVHEWSPRFLSACLRRFQPARPR